MKRYNTIPTIKSDSKKKIYPTVRYPEIPRSIDDIYITTTIGDRYDILSQKYYNDSSLWWIISNANKDLPQDSLFPPLGEQIRIPSNPKFIIAEYKNLNSN
tara:strand:+ start:1275 stop:1577 length:303 start_codon:yes stop_codon:yes gene_type:complete